MQLELMKQEGQLGCIGNVACLTQNSLEFTREPTEEDLEFVGQALAKAEGATQWWIGDWALRVVPNLPPGGKNPQENNILLAMCEKVGFTYETVREYRRVAKIYPFGVRTHNAYWTHYWIASKYDKENATKWLKAAEENKWDTTELRRQIQEYKAQEKAEAAKARKEAGEPDPVILPTTDESRHWGPTDEEREEMGIEDPIVPTENRDHGWLDDQVRAAYDRFREVILTNADYGEPVSKETLMVYLNKLIEIVQGGAA